MTSSVKCIICLDLIESINIQNRFSCKCKDIVFHDYCFREFEKMYSFCPQCRKCRKSKEDLNFVFKILFWIFYVNFLLDFCLSFDSKIMIGLLCFGFFT